MIYLIRSFGPSIVYSVKRMLVFDIATTTTFAAGNDKPDMEHT